MKADIIVKSIIYNKNLNKILLIQRSDIDHIGAGTWENAGGKVELGEDLERAIKREIREETGITDIIIEGLAYVTLVNGENPHLFIVYLCESQNEFVTLSDEHQGFVWADKEECVNKLPKDIIDDFEKNHIFNYWGME